MVCHLSIVLKIGSCHCQSLRLCLKVRWLSCITHYELIPTVTWDVNLSIDSFLHEYLTCRGQQLQLLQEPIVARANW